MPPTNQFGVCDRSSKSGRYGSGPPARSESVGSAGVVVFLLKFCNIESLCEVGVWFDISLRASREIRFGEFALCQHRTVGRIKPQVDFSTPRLASPGSEWQVGLKAEFGLGEFLEPKYLSERWICEDLGSYIEAYRAENDLTAAYNIAKLTYL
jgi:hypothetical protein